MDEEKKYYQIKLLNKIKNIRNILWIKNRLFEKTSRIFKKNCIVAFSRNITSTSKLVEFSINVGFNLDIIDFDTAYKLCKLTSCYRGD